jgi:predicted dehydrogenase
MINDEMSRRSFVGGVGKAAFAATILPRHVLGGPGYLAPSDTVNLAFVGIGGMGMSNAQALVNGGQKIVAIADVDFPYVERGIAGRQKNRDGTPNAQGVALGEQYAKSKKYADYREMLEKERKNLDGVVIATPDHTHALAASAAMQLGKGVYVQKPLTYTVQESRRLAELAKSTGVATQMGNQGHSTDSARKINEWVQAGVIGPVREVQVWTNRPIWPQGVPRPASGPFPSSAPDAERWGQHNVQGVFHELMGGNYSPPPGLDWNLYLSGGPEIPYHPIYHPFNWRGWADWGVGALGDMGAHLIDHPFWALNLGLPTSIEATFTPWGMDAGQKVASYPLASTVHYEFAPRDGMPGVKMTWLDGGLMPARPDILPESVLLDRGGGVMLVGEKGILIHETYGANPHFYPESLMETAMRVPQTMARVPNSHEMNWVDGIRGVAQPSSPFEYAARLTETMLLGVVAMRVGQGKRIFYDAKNMAVTNVPEANQYLSREYRSGWGI